MSNKMCNDCWLSMQNCHDKSICCEMDEYDGEQCDWFEPMHIVHGHWDVHEDTYGDDEAKCSVCGFEMAVNQPGNGLCMVSELNYCPHCGAMMDEVTE